MRLKGSGFNSALGIPRQIRPPSKEEPTLTTSSPTASRGFVSRYGNLAVERLGGQLECELAGRCRKRKGLQDGLQPTKVCWPDARNGSFRS